MIGFFIKSGDTEIGNLFRQYVWKELGIDVLIKKNIINNYSKDLNLLLIMYYVEGKFPVNPPEDGKVNNYSTKEKSISVSISVTKEKFHERTEEERRKFIVESIKLAVKKVNERMSKKKMEFDAEGLLSDLEEKVFSIYLNM